MRVWGTVKKLFKALSVTDPKAWDSGLWNFKPPSNISESTAITYSAIWCAVTLISNAVSTLPLKLIRKVNGKTIEATDLSLYHVMYSKANPYMTAQVSREDMMAHLLLCGNAFYEIVRDRVGNVISLWPIAPSRVRMEMIDGILYYHITVDHNKPPVTLSREQILHIPGLGFDGYCGYSVIKLASKSINLSLAMEEYGNTYFSNGTHPGVVISHPGALGEEAYNHLKKSLTEAHSGLGNAHRLMLLEEAMKIEKITIAPEEAQFIEARQHQIPEVARWFNLPPHKLKDLTRSSFSNIAEEQVSYLTDSILPWLIRLEQNYNIQLLTDAQRVKMGLYFKHNFAGMLRGSSENRANYYKALWSVGAISINEIRDKEDMDPVDGGDEYFVPLNMVPLSRVNEIDYSKQSRTEPVEDDADKKQDAKLMLLAKNNSRKGE